MSRFGRGQSSLSAALLFTSALWLLAPATAGAQTPTPPPPPTEPATGGQATPEQAPPPAPPAPEPAPAPAPPKSYPQVLPTRDIKLTDHFAIRFGLQAQVWYELLQDATETDGEQANQVNFFCRRCRVLMNVQPWDNINLFLLIEAGNLGRGTGGAAAPFKGYNNINVLDAYANIKFSNAAMLEFGLMLVPLARNVVMGTTTYIGLDVNFTSAQHLAATQTTVLRDVGILLHGYLLNDKLGYRLGAFSGIRDAAVSTGTPPVPVSAPNENMPRIAGYLQYNILDADMGYVYNGCYYGRKRIAGVSAGFDFQKGSSVGDLDAPDPYLAFSAAAFAAIPISGVNKAGADEVHGLVQFVHYDGGSDPGMLNGTAPGLRNQNDLAVELGYYNKATKLSVFGGFEGRFIAEEEDEAIVPTQMWFGGGVKYHLIDNLLNFTLAFKRSQFGDNAPDAFKSFNQFVLAAQALYY